MNREMQWTDGQTELALISSHRGKTKKTKQMQDNSTNTINNSL